MSDVTMQELELETAELLPSRETLCCWRGGTNIVNSFDHQFSLVNGNVASGNSVALINLGNQNSSATAIGNAIG